MYSYIVFALICGVVSAFIAKNNGRSAVVWFVSGAAFTFLGLGAILLITKKS